jgi:hypothetical protein
MITALNGPHELKLHVRGAINNGLTKDEVKEVFCKLQFIVSSAIDSFRVASKCSKKWSFERTTTMSRTLFRFGNMGFPMALLQPHAADHQLMAQRCTPAPRKFVTAHPGHKLLAAPPTQVVTSSSQCLNSDIVDSVVHELAPHPKAWRLIIEMKAWPTRF